MVGEITAVRAFKLLKSLKLYVASTISRPWFSEQTSNVQGTDLLPVIGRLDITTAKEQTARFQQEHTDAFCLARDVRYSNRSRRWLFTKAIQSRYDGCYEQWASYVRENLTTDKLSDIATKDPDDMAKIPFDELMKK